MTSRNRWEDRSPRIREIRACANLPDDRRAACWIKFDLLESGRRYVVDDDLWYACDALSGSLERLASGLIETCACAVGDVLEAGPILYFDRLETRNDLQGSGLGIQLAQHLLSELVDRYRPAFLVLCPYPLQFEHCNIHGEPSDLEHARYEKAFARCERKLVRLYERKFGVTRLGENSNYWGTSLSDFGFRQGAFGWDVW